LDAATGSTPRISAAHGLPRDAVGVTLSVVAGAAHRREGYELVIGDEGVHVVARDSAGAFYGAMTLVQLIERHGAELPRLSIADWPDLPARGVLLDVSRNRVPSMATLFTLVDRLAGWKVNQLQLYTEHTFAYARHPEVWADASPLTGEEILELDAFCRDRFVELVPNQNSLGHLQRWLSLDRYRPLAEAPEGFDTTFRRVPHPFSLCPTDPASMDFLRGLYDELLPHFSSRLFNVGADETDDIGQGRSRAAVEERGFGRVYLEFLLALHREVRARGRTMLFWGDILLRHPELVPELPRDTIVLDWGYDADYAFETRSRAMVDAGIPFYVCPGTSSWDSIAGRSSNAVANLRRAARAGTDHGAAGLLNCDWGDSGHWQPLAVSLLPFAYGAGVSWHADANEGSLLQAAEVHAFGEGDATLGEAAVVLGDVHRAVGPEVPNGSLPFLVLRAPPAVTAALMAGSEPPHDVEPRIVVTPTVARALGTVTRDALERSRDALAVQRAGLARLEVRSDEGQRARRELEWCAALLDHALRRALWIESTVTGDEDSACRRELADDAPALLAGFEEIWHARHRPGGFADSLRELQASFLDYAA
jgi:hypothetical protein